MVNKVKISESQFDRALYAMLVEKPLLTESDQLTDGDVERIAKKSIKTYLESGRSAELENKIKTAVRQMAKNDKMFQDAIVEISRNVIVQLYKALWTKKSFWVNDLRNSSN